MAHLVALEQVVIMELVAHLDQMDQVVHPVTLGLVELQEQVELRVRLDQVEQVARLDRVEQVVHPDLLELLGLLEHPDRTEQVVHLV